MTSAIARWHSSARPPSDALEQAYADQLEAEMQEMAIQLHKVTEYWLCKCLLFWKTRWRNGVVVTVVVNCSVQTVRLQEAGEFSLSSV